jgi:hypothetical protein
MLEALIKGLTLGLLLSISVGPVIFSIIKQSLNSGHHGGIAFVLGVSASDILLVLVSNVFTQLFGYLVKHKEFIGIAGSIFLISMGIYFLFFKKVKVDDSGVQVIQLTKRDYLKTFLSGFFMNTLNNIHSLIEGDRGLAQDAVLKLSELMRYLLYESGRGTTTLQKEIDFIKSYVELMELRVDKSVNVTLELPDNYINISLPPLLFISFIENAFKHGVSYREPSSLSFSLSQAPGSIIFLSSNTISKFREIKVSQHHGGLGLENIRRRLDMLYGDKYELEIGKNENEFRVKLIIPA